MLFKIQKGVTQICSVNKELLKNSRNSQENTCARVSFLITLQAKACNLIKKETLAQALFRKILKNTFFYRTPLVPASNNSVVYKKKRVIKVNLLWSN